MDPNEEIGPIRAVLLSSSYDIENPFTFFSDEEKCKALKEFKAQLFNFGASMRYLDPSESLCMAVCCSGSCVCGMVGMMIGGVCLSLYSLDTAGLIGVTSLTAVSFFSLCGTVAFNFSAKCRAHFIGLFNKPITLPSINLTTLNQLLNSVNLPSEVVHTTQDLKRLRRTLDNAIQQTSFSYQYKLGRTILAALKTNGFFAGGQHIVLNYLISDEKIMDRLFSTKRP